MAGPLALPCLVIEMLLVIMEDLASKILCNELKASFFALVLKSMFVPMHKHQFETIWSNLFRNTSLA